MHGCTDSDLTGPRGHTHKKMYIMQQTDKLAPGHWKKMHEVQRLHARGPRPNTSRKSSIRASKTCRNATWMQFESTSTSFLVNRANEGFSCSLRSGFASSTDPPRLTQILGGYLTDTSKKPSEEVYLEVSVSFSSRLSGKMIFCRSAGHKNICFFVTLTDTDTKTCV